MLSVLQLVIASFAIYGASTFSEEIRLLIPLGCLFLMLMVYRIDKRRLENKATRKTFLESEINKIWKKETVAFKDQDFFTIESLVWPKSELLLIDAVHAIFKDLGFRISAPVHYQTVDRIVKLQDADKMFGLQIIMCENDVEENHPKVGRALKFEKDRKVNEKILIIASTHIHLPLSERGKASCLSKEMLHFLIRHQISLVTSHHLYELWQEAKGGEIDIFEVFQKIYLHPGGIFYYKKNANSNSHSLPINLRAP